jgi:hypothetical protein
MAVGMAKLHQHGRQFGVAVESALTARGCEPMTPNGRKGPRGELRWFQQTLVAIAASQGFFVAEMP